MRLLFVVLSFFSFNAYSAAYHICFSNSDVGMSEKSMVIQQKQLSQAIKAKDEDLIIYHLMWNKENRYEIGTALYKLQQQAIFFDAIHGDKLDTAKQLLAKGVDVNRFTRVDYQLTPLMIASSCGYKDMVRMLLNAGAKVNLLGGYGGSKTTTALSGAKQLFNNDNIELEVMDEIVGMLEAAGAKECKYTAAGLDCSTVK